MSLVVDRRKVERITFPCLTQDDSLVHIHVDIDNLDDKLLIDASLLLRFAEDTNINDPRYHPSEACAIFPMSISGDALLRFAQQLEEILADRAGSARLDGYESSQLLCLTYCAGKPDIVRVGGHWAPLRFGFLDAPCDDNFCSRYHASVNLFFDGFHSRHRLDLETYAADIKRFLTAYDIVTDPIDTW